MQTCRFAHLYLNPYSNFKIIMSKRNHLKNSAVVEDSVNNDKRETTISHGNESRTLIMMELKEHYQNALKQLDSQLEFQLSRMEFMFSTVMSSIPKEVLGTEIKMDDELLNIIFECPSEIEEEPSSSSNNTEYKTILKSRRSRSVTSSQRTYNTSKKAYNPNRSHSVESHKTPVNKVNIATLTTNKKYTVTKPLKKVEDTGITLKRTIKPSDEVISAMGSPLFVHPSTVLPSAPTVNIPLPGGIVVNIEPRKPRGQFVVPDLDERTKAQLRLLCEQMNNLL